MSKYLLNDEIQKEEFYVHDDGKEMTIRDSLEDVPEAEREKYSKEWIEYKVPSWNVVANINEMASGGMTPFPIQQTVDRMLIMLFLHGASFFEVRRGIPEEPEEAPEQMLNIDELIGPKGVVPTLINKIILTLRRRM